MTHDREWYTYEQAARRVSRNVRTIKKWRVRGMPMSTDEHGRRIVRRDDLLAWWRQAMSRDNANRHASLRLAIEDLI